MKEHLTLIGVMSGTSLDGLDLIAVEFDVANPSQFNIHCAESLPYNNEQKKWFNDCLTMSGEELAFADREFGRFIGEQVRLFAERHNLSFDAVASHGHTLFHSPDDGLSYQIGHGAAIAAAAETTTICDFRSLDVALGGQGAPLVPIGDELLFSQYDACLNLGGFSNISFKTEGNRIAFDICPANMALNHIASDLGMDFDKGGEIARSGKLNSTLLDSLNALEYYHLEAPKSLGREWYESTFTPLLESTSLNAEDKLRTVTEHIAIQIAKALSDKSSVLITGGGALNKYLIERIQDLSTSEIIIPNKELIEFKEALIFALLGLLRLQHKTNTMRSVTGAKYDSVGGAIYHF